MHDAASARVRRPLGPLGSSSSQHTVGGHRKFFCRKTSPPPLSRSPFSVRHALSVSLCTSLPTSVSRCAPKTRRSFKPRTNFAECDPNEAGLSRFISRKGRGVRLRWEHSHPKGPNDSQLSASRRAVRSVDPLTCFSVLAF